MLSGQHFYNRTTRKMVVAFGNLFNNIRLVRYNKANTLEMERITVPISYAQKEKFYARLSQDPNLNQAVSLTLPRMSFELISITYDPVRKTSMFNRTFAPLDGNSVQSMRMTPYNFDFTLNIYVRNAEDGTQIVEQILPYFAPDLTISADIAGYGQPIDVPIILQNVSYEPDYVGGPDPVRTLMWTLNFTMKGFMYGPSSNVSVIRKVTTNVHTETISSLGTRRIFVGGGIGTFKIGELVYQGRTPETATSTAYVKDWVPSTNTLIVYDSSGQIRSNAAITGAVSNAAYTISTTDINTNQMLNITITPDPPNANANSAYGFDTVVEEFPNIT
jgi:hypothetical protein